MRRSLVALVVGCSFVAPTALSTVGAGAQQASARLSLASQTAWMRNDTFTVRLDVDRVRRPQDLDLVVTVHRAVTSRSQFARTIDGDLLGGRVHRDEIPFQSLRFDAGGAIPITVALPELRTGVYPTHVELVDDGRTVASLVTHIVRVSDEPAEVPLSVAWVQPYAVAPALRPDGTVELGEDELDHLRTIAAQLDGDAPLTVVPNPETVSALVALDAGRTVAALARLLEGHQVVSRPFVDIDVSALVGAGRAGDVVRQRAEGDRVLTDALGVASDTRTWPLRGVVTAEALRVLDHLGVRRVVLDEEAMVALPSAMTRGLTLARPFSVEDADGTELDAVAVDAGLTAHFEEDDDVLAAHHLLADVAVLHLDAPGIARGVVIRPPEDWTPSEALLSSVLGNFASSPVVEPVTIDRLFQTIDPLEDRSGDAVVRELAAEEPPTLGVASSELDRARGLMDGFASFAGATNDELGTLDRMLLLAESRSIGRAARQSYLDGAFDRIGAAAANVRVLGDRTFRLTAREGTIPLTFVNDNPYDVRVKVALASDKLDFTGVELVDLPLRANRSTTQTVPVKALTSGAFPLRVSVTSPDGRLQLGRTQFTVTSTVASGVGILLSAGAAGFLLLWWGSHWRTVRRARRLVPPE